MTARRPSSTRKRRVDRRDARNWGMYRDWLVGGYTFEELGEQHGITKQRAHQVIKRAIEEQEE